MTDQMLLDRMSQMIRLGFVNARQPEKMRVTVTLPDTTGSQLITDWLPVLCPRACGDMQFDLPDIGDQVLCLFLAYGLEQGFVIGSMYGRQTPPVASGDKWHRKFSDGAYLEYDRASHSLVANIPGTASIKASQSISLEAPIIYIRGNLQHTAKDGSPGISNFSGGMNIQNGGLNVVSGDVVASGVSLVSHETEGVQAGNDTSSHPKGGASNSPGTRAMPLPGFGTAAYMAWILSGLLDLREQMDNDSIPPTKIDNLIYCLPEIAENMASLCKLDANIKGWKYLAEMFKRWLAGFSNSDAAKGGVPFKVDWDWLKEFSRSKKPIDELSLRKNLFTTNSEKLLGKRLNENGYLQDDECDFDFIYPPVKFYNGDILRAWHQWPGLYFQSREVERQWWLSFDEDATRVDGEQVSMGSFMIYALAKGKTKPLVTGGHQIIVEKVALVAYDSFNFQGVDFYFFWNCADKLFSLNPLKEFIGFHALVNSDFDSFRSKYGHGGDFLVISGPESVDFGGQHEYKYPL